MAALFHSIEPASPEHYVRGQYDGYRSIDGVAADSTTETYAALRLEIENWRWAGVPFFIRTGKRLPVTQTELRLVFKRPPRLGMAGGRVAEANQLVVKLDPSTGVRLVVDAHRADTSGPAPITLDIEFAEEGGEGPTPYEVLLHAALVGRQQRASPGRTASRRRGGSCSRCSTRRRRCTRTRRDRGARPRPSELVSGHGALARALDRELVHRERSRR